jgi:hypothetical protein
MKRTAVLVGNRTHLTSGWAPAPWNVEDEAGRKSWPLTMRGAVRQGR